MRLSFTQPICAVCWRRDHPDNPYTGLYEGELGKCCKCGLHTRSGIYIRVDPTTVPYPTITKEGSALTGDIRDDQIEGSYIYVLPTERGLPPMTILGKPGGDLTTGTPIMWSAEHRLVDARRPPRAARAEPDHHRARP